MNHAPENRPTNGKQGLAIAIVIAIGLVLAALILTMRSAGDPAPGHDEHAGQVDHEGKPHQEAAVPSKGPHGGKLFAEGGYSLSIPKHTIVNVVLVAFSAPAVDPGSQNAQTK